MSEEAPKVCLVPVSTEQVAIAKEKVFIGAGGKLVGEKDPTAHTLFAGKGQAVAEDKLKSFENAADFF
jgi:hypothetical protein